MYFSLPKEYREASNEDLAGRITAARERLGKKVVILTHHYQRLEVAGFGDHVGDSYGTYLVLREELSQFLSDNGFFRDILYYVDVLCAQVYANYICEQGGSYLRTDFSAPEDPMQHTRRLLGLDGVRPGNGKTKLKSIDGESFVIGEGNLLNQAEETDANS